MLKQEIKNVLLAQGWREDRFGHLKHQGQNYLYRVKFQAISIRLERRYTTPNGNDWAGIAHAYCKDVHLAMPDGNLIIGHVKLKIANRS